MSAVTLKTPDDDADKTVTAPGSDGLGFAVDINRKHPVADQIYDALKEAIVSVQLLPGTSISENRICRHFGVSRTPVRSAVVRLSEDGLVDVYPQQGSFVSPIRLAEINDSHFVRKNLEIALLREAATKWSPEKSAHARAIIEVQRQAIEAGDGNLFFREDEHFHQAFAGFAEREGVWATVLQAKARLARFVRLFGKPDRLPVVVREHLAILDALDARQIDRAIQQLDYHLDMAFTILKQLPDEYGPYVVE
ncbi:GntR family transcriptional regulator [Labrys monachus]|uniref:DNA-binding GntR family transcriptional regulator n=1 Tax=Labrys monachus TaxID=217067 RepID=A0ABU0FI85_9HYPH|nr:GntR family transcriptional regulator [Labrys monachus]MDQ0394186.1 DNA-binding GntR family transcriptional regulator [Labrys monachus]